MRTCATGCGREARTIITRLCDTCFDAWQTETPGRVNEQARYIFHMHNAGAQRVAMADFCNRVRAERNNRGNHEP